MSKQEQNLSTTDNAAQLSGLMCEYIAHGARNLQNNMWTIRSMSFVKAFVPVMEALHQAGVTELEPVNYTDYLRVQFLLELAFATNGKYGEQFEEIKKPLVSYLESLPGFNPKNPLAVADKLADQHGLIAMTFTRVVGEMVTFGTSTLKTDYMGMTLLELLIAYNNSLVVQEDKDSMLFLPEIDAQDSVFGNKEDQLDDDHSVFSKDKSESIFVVSKDDQAAENVDFFSKSENGEDHIFDLKISKAS